MEKPKSNIAVFQMSNYVKPAVEELRNKDWVLNGPKNSFFQYVINRYNGSPTNSALIDAYIDRIYGKGLSLINANINAPDLAQIISFLSKEDVRRIVSDFVLFGSAVGVVRYGKSTKRAIAKIEHLERIKTAPAKVNKKNEIYKYYVHNDWIDTNSVQPVSYPAFGTSTNAPIEVFEIKPYKAGKTYFSDPYYIAGLQYASLEEEIANYSNNHIKAGLSAGFMINFPDGKVAEELMEETERSVQRKLTGSNNAGKVFLSWTDSPELAPTITAIPTSANHEQWQFWADEARQQLLVAHRVTTPMLFGVKDNTGLGNNAKEMEEGSKLLHETTIRPKQNVILDVLQRLVGVNNISTPLRFIPLEDEEEKEQKKIDETPIDEKPAEGDDSKKDSDEKVDLNRQLALSTVADYLITLGDDMPDDFEQIELRDVSAETMSEERLNEIFSFANVPSQGASGTSKQDTSIFKIRYIYAGSKSPERDFCRKLMSANKIYSFEDLKKAESLAVQPGMGPKGAKTYSIFKYKGGVNCKHFWQRAIYLKKDNKRIGVNEAQRMILALEPKDRKEAKWERNPKEVAVIASPSNNHWKLK